MNLLVVWLCWVLRVCCTWAGEGFVNGNGCLSVVARVTVLNSRLYSKLLAEVCALSDTGVIELWLGPWYFDPETWASVGYCWLKPCIVVCIWLQIVRKGSEELLQNLSDTWWKPEAQYDRVRGLWVYKCLVCVWVVYKGWSYQFFCLLWLRFFGEIVGFTYYMRASSALLKLGWSGSFDFNRVVWTLFGELRGGQVTGYGVMFIFTAHGCLWWRFNCRSVWPLESKQYRFKGSLAEGKAFLLL